MTDLKHDGMAPTSIMFFKDVGHSQEGAQEVAKIMDGGFFNGPKPQRLLKRLLTLANLKENSIVLDFFSGSASTGHAVMSYNKENDKNCKFVLVQIPEKCDEKSEAYKAGYKTICEIGKERIRRAGDQILELSLQNLEKEGVIEKIEKSKLSALSSQHSKELSLQNLDGVDSVEYCREAISGDQGVYPVFENSKGITSGTGNTIVDLRTLKILNERGYRIKPEALGRNQQNDIFADKAFDIKGLSSKLSVLNSDRGFRVLKLASSNMKDVYYSPAETTSPDLFDPNNVKEDRTPLDLLFQVMPECNLPLSSKIEERTIEGKTVYFVNGNYLVACFDEGITEKLIKAVIDVPDSEKPYYFYMRNLGLESDKVLDNFEQLFVHYSPSTRRKVI